MNDTTLCDEIIDYSLSSPNRHSGKILGENGKPVVNKEIKDSMDSVLNHNVPLCTKYMNWLGRILHEYRLKYDPYCNRYLVFATYLNTVEDQGGTAFKYQDLTIKAEKGLTMIWPSDFPFTHRGVISPTEEKFIVTGWIHVKE